MRLMKVEEMLAVCEAGAEARKGLAARMAPLYEGRPSAWIGDSVRMGRSQVYEVRRGGTVVCVFWGYVSKLNNTFVVNAAGSLVKYAIHDDLFWGIEDAAKKHGCQALQFQTARRGLVEIALAKSYAPEGIVMSKLL